METHLEIPSYKALHSLWPRTCSGPRVSWRLDLHGASILGFDGDRIGADEQRLATGAVGRAISQSAAPNLARDAGGEVTITL